MLRCVVAVLVSLPLLVLSGSGRAEVPDRPRARPETVIDLATLPVGAPPTSLYAADHVIHDGATSVPVRLTQPVRLIGRVVGGYVVQTISRSGFHGKLYRIDAQTGAVVKLGRSSDLDREPRVMGRGRYLAYGACCAPPQVTVRSTETGKVVAKRTFSGYPELVDAARSRVLVSREAPLLNAYWQPFQDRVTSVGPVGASVPLVADAEHGLAYVLRPRPGWGPCGELIRTARPSRPLWRDCGVQVLAFAPDAQTVLALSTRSSAGSKGLVGIEVRRTSDGALLHAYSGVDMNPVHYDGPDHLVFIAHVKGSAAGVRCDFAGTCERVSDLVAESAYESYALDWSFPADREGVAVYGESFYYDEY